MLQGLGMPLRDRRRLMSREINVFLVLPAVFLIISSVVFLTGSCSVRMCDSDLIIRCTEMYAAMIAAWIAVNAIFTWLIKVLIGKEILFDE